MEAKLKGLRHHDHTAFAAIPSVLGGPAVDPDRLLANLHYAYPTAIFLIYGICSTVIVLTLQASAPEDKHPHRSRLSWLMLASVLTYLTELLSLAGQCLAAMQLPPHQDTVIGLLSCILVFGVQLAGLSEDENPVWYPYIAPYGAALVLEPFLTTLSLVARSPRSLGHFEVLTLISFAVRELLFVLVVTLYFVGRSRRHRPVEDGGEDDDAERQPLLGRSENTSATAADGTYTGYCSTATATSTPSSSDESSDAGSSTANGSDAGVSKDDGSKTAPDGTTAKSRDDNKKHANNTEGVAESPWERRQRKNSERMEKRLKENGNWFTYVKSFVIFVPYIWPVNNRGLQVRAVLVGFCLLANNALNVLIPRQMGVLTDSLSGNNDESPWKQVLIFAALKLTASEAGLSLLRQWLWIPVEYYSYGAMSTAAYSHVLNLSSDFHDAKSSSDIMVAIQSGRSVSDLLDSVCFHALPMIVDMALAFTYLSATFGPYEGLITVATAMVFLHIATRMIRGLREARKSEVSAYFEEHYVRQAGIQGWSTVACFNQVPYEEQRYSKAVQNRVSRSQAVYVGYLVAYAFQYLVLLAGLLAGAFLAVYQVTSGQATPGMFITLLIYWAQLVAPLNFFATLGKTVSRNLINAEQLLEIMRTKPTVVSKKDAPPLEFAGGNVKFDGVCFSYDDKKQILKDLTFAVPSGSTVAFVGATGAGKSTILKLLGRFYDVNEGSISIDGQDLRDVDLGSLRAQIGIVPQSPVLFDDSVMNNVRYARLTATDEEVFEACKAACVHDQVLSFADGYSTRVGERGIKLSGGELQRLAIARAILKKPSIVLLDEATSSVDTETEHRIQEALGSLCAGRTTFIVAHRLSTVMNAHTIMVVSGGQIVEHGPHHELIKAGGKYAELWSKQVLAKPHHKSSLDSPCCSDGDAATEGGLVCDVDVLAVEEATAVATPAGSPKAEAAKGPQDSDEPDDHGDLDGRDDCQTQPLPIPKTPSGHKREGSKLNPDAPTFTPRTYGAAVAAAAVAAADVVSRTEAEATVDHGESSQLLGSPIEKENGEGGKQRSQPSTGQGGEARSLL